MAKRKLQMLSNHVFEELAMDAYDEVDRRETDAIWNGLLSKVSDVIMHELAMPKVPFINFIFSYDFSSRNVPIYWAPNIAI